MKIDNLTLAFGNKIVLDKIDLEIQKGEFVFFIGASGSGKTSMIRSLIGDFKPQKGNIILNDGSDLYKKGSNDNFITLFRRKIGVVFQDYKILESKTVQENVEFAMEVCNYSYKDIIKRVPEVLKQVDLLTKKDRFTFELSGGEKQRVAIARALVHNPDLIIGDEPTGNLDPKTALNVIDIFNELNELGKTIIIATHDKNLVNHYKKRVITFKDRKIFSDNNPGEYNI